MRKVTVMCCALLCSLFANAETMKINRFKYAGPHQISAPYATDKTDVNGKEFDAKSLLNTYISFSQLENAPYINASDIPSATGNQSIAMLEFSLQNEKYAQGNIKVEGVENYVVYLDGKKLSGSKIEVIPATHTVVVKYLCTPEQKGAPAISVETEQEGAFTLREDGKRQYALTDVLHGKRFQGVQLSPCGKWLITNYNTSLAGGKSVRTTTLTEVATGTVTAPRGEWPSWMPKSSLYWYTREDAGGRHIITVDPATGKETVFAKNIPAGWFQIAPSEDYLLYSREQKGPAEKEEIYEVIGPDDRQPGWRNRSYLAKYDLTTGVMQPLTFGYRNTWVADISEDGKKMMFFTNRGRLTERPTTLTSLHMMDMETLQTTTIIEDDGFISGAKFSPCGAFVAITGTPESLGGIGKNVKEGQTPSMYDYQLYIMDLGSRKIKAVTREFNPAVGSIAWSRYDNQIYFTAENKDMVSLYKMNPSSGKISQIKTREDLVKQFTIADAAPVMVWYGQSASNSDKAYIADLKKGTSTLWEDLSKDILEDVQLGECRGWNFRNSKGDEINGRYYLPANFNPEKKYPLIVNYYGGCSPTERNFESRYPHHLYAAMGYVVYVVNPSGATGFGQEFSARHVNTAGDGPAQDIIEGTKQFCKEHPFVDATKIGCIGASYGGFMTQYLQTQTDIFAAAISHAGISDHTSYWGEGYWGYSYSEVSMANSYPWSHRDLYVEQSPLYNAHKVNTPILFLHGDKDNNVPVGESIQMYTALKLLGKETAMVLVKDQDHHILDYNKRIQWQNTIFAWFAKWLQNDPTWWNAMYPPKTL